MNQNLLMLGIILIFIGIFFIIVSNLIGEKGKTEVKGAVVGFIGPIPFGFGSNKDIVCFSLTISIIIIALLLIMSRIFFKI